MTTDIFFLLGYIFLILFLLVIPLSRKILKEHTTELLTFSASYIFLLADIKSDSTNIVMFNENWKDLNTPLIITGILIGLISISMSAFEKSKQQSHKTLSDELKVTKSKFEKVKEEYYNLCSDNIKDLFSDFFGLTNGNGRVSLYKHHGTHFTLLGRFSNNPVYSMRGLESYPDNEGFIAKGWQQQRFEIHTIPEWKGNGSSYRSFMREKCNITDERLKKLTMKSRAFYIYRFDNHDASNPHGIIVFEQMNDIQIQTATIDTIFQTHGTQIISLLKFKP